MGTAVARRSVLAACAAAAVGTALPWGVLESGRADAATARRVRRVRFGAWDPAGLDGIDALERDLGRPLDIVHIYQGWGVEDNAFDAYRAGAIVARGGRPLVTWEPWDYRRGLDQPEFSLRRIVSGDHDDYIRQWGRDLEQFGHVVWLRFAHEMNHHVYPWCVGVNGNTARLYVRAWRRVVRLIRAEGATNVRFVWSPNVPSPGSPSLKACYPGDRYVDLVGMDGYNAGSAADWGGWLSFTQVFGPLYRRLRRISSRPVIVAETGCAEEGGDKARWIESAFSRELPERFPAVIAVVWFNEQREANWRLDSSRAALHAARTTFTSARFSR